MLNFKKFKYRLPDSPWRLPDSPSRGVADSLTRQVFLLNIQKPTPRLAKSESQRLPDSLSRRVTDSPSQGVVFRLRTSPQIRSQKRDGSKGSVRDLWGPNFCKNPRKSASLPCPFKEPRNRFPRIDFCDGIFKQSMRARNRVWIRLS